MKLLHIDSSVLGAKSASRQLSAALVEKLTALHPGLEVTYHDLASETPMQLSPAHVGAWFGHAPSDPAVQADIAMTDHYIPEVMAADFIVVGMPMYNFSIPTQLKSWIDRILIANKTFKYGENGAPVGLVPAGKKVFVASTRGGMYTPGNPAAPFDHQEPLLLAALGFIGLRDVTIIRAEGLAIPGKKEPALEAALKEIAALTA
jgi:FMN-dependent NADH-azoreductase